MEISVWYFWVFCCLWLFLHWWSVSFWGWFIFEKGLESYYFFGLLQPISDAIKLFSKEFIEGYKILFLFYFGGPLMGLLLIFLLWGIWGGFGSCWGRVFSMLYIFSLIRLGVYFLLFCGWGSMRKYSLFGCYRSISQTISYEVIIIFFLFDLCFFDRFFWFGFFFFLSVWFVIWIFLFVGFYLLVVCCISWEKPNSFWFFWGRVWTCFWFQCGVWWWFFFIDFYLRIWYDYFFVFSFCGNFWWGD